MTRTDNVHLDVLSWAILIAGDESFIRTVSSRAPFSAIMRVLLHLTG